MSNKTFLEQIGERVYNKRKKQKLSQAELAEKIGVSVQMISNLECGKKAIRPENIVKICEALNISADYLLTGYTADNEMSDILEKLSNLSPSEIKIINEMIDYMNNNKW